jgi:hypothetical protein
VVPLIFVVGAVVVVAVLILVLMRQRWNDGTRPGWEPDSVPRIEPPPRAYVTLTVVGYLVALHGLVLAAVFRIPALGIACLVLFAASWVTRIALIRWRDALTSVRKVVAVASPLAFVAAIAVMMITSSPWWFLVGGLVYLVPSYVISYMDWRGRRRSVSRD